MLRRNSQRGLSKKCVKPVEKGDPRAEILVVLQLSAGIKGVCNSRMDQPSNANMDAMKACSGTGLCCSLWGWVFRLPLSAVGRAHLTPTGNRVEKRAGLQDLLQKPATVYRCLAPAKPGAIRQLPACYKADQKAYQPEPDMDFWPVEDLEPLWRSSSFTLIPGNRLAREKTSGLPARPTPEARHGLT